MTRWPAVLLLLSLLVASESCAQGATPGAGAAPPAQGLHFIYVIRHGWYDASDPPRGCAKRTAIGLTGVVGNVRSMPVTIPKASSAMPRGGVCPPSRE